MLDSDPVSGGFKNISVGLAQVGRARSVIRCNTVTGHFPSMAESTAWVCRERAPGGNRDVKLTKSGSEIFPVALTGCGISSVSRSSSSQPPTRQGREMAAVEIVQVGILAGGSCWRSRGSKYCRGQNFWGVRSGGSREYTR